MRSSQYLALPILASMLLLAACRGEEQAGQAPQRPPAQVGIVTTQREALPVVSDLPGRIAPTRIAEVRPRVNGIIVRRVFEQGSDVEEGQPLFEIDRATYEVEVEAARASVMRAEASLLRARQDAERAQQLVSTRTTSQATFDTAVAALKQAEADLASARASQRGAEINLDYTTVRAPIAGRIGRALVTEGALVSLSSTEALATIQQLDPVYADVQQPVTELIRLRQALANGELEQVEPDVAKVSLMLDDGTPYGEPGRLLFSEATVDPTSGQVTLRSEFPNTDGNLLPGMYVRVAVEQGIDQAAIAVPSQAVQRDTAGRSQLYVLDGDNKIMLRAVTIARTVGNRAIVAQGLEPGERVVVDGFQKTGPGATVEPVAWTDPTAAPAADAPQDGAAGADQGNAAAAPGAGAADAAPADANATPSGGDATPQGNAPAQAGDAPAGQTAE
ncbi:efflux RND transporter periplasmic adaptor subunit [Aureimonas frigidaquae]|uniref:Efflux transporter, RND family, MFP subunit n=1 Tax=Aureimonas frigidaquae TaxID=424757 RepID=A0A0P0Z0N6_9HYPH|nr:efflux RND transporter periplasmic adaptor subunit [Aureimonas frigidaquae]BAT27523.1 efflux transporter, RND family, MFP subunit precursor [Aureimonas frigidaquae]